VIKKIKNTGIVFSAETYNFSKQRKYLLLCRLKTSGSEEMKEAQKFKQTQIFRNSVGKIRDLIFGGSKPTLFSLKQKRIVSP